MAKYRLYSHIQDLHSADWYFVALDLTRLDFRSNPPLNYYVKHWFIDVDDLVDFLLSRLNLKITLIVSDLLANIICDVIHSIFPQIIRIIIVGDRPCHCEKIEHFFNVQELVDNLSFALRERRRLYITFDSWPVERTSYDLNKHTAKYLWYRYFFNILSHLKNTDQARTEMLRSVRAFHSKQIDVVKKSCEDFEKSYRSQDIIKWYSRTSFFYLLLNRTLRSEDINHIFAMRYVISDLENSLQENCDQQKTSSIDTVYRGQQMHSNEIQEIEANIGGLIGLTSFWSTSRSLKTALDFTELWPPQRTDCVERVLFSIQIPSDFERATYVDISHLSSIGREFEVLFSLRSLFRVERVMRNGNDRFWYVDLTLIDENNDQFISAIHPWHLFTKNTINQRCFFTPQNAPSKRYYFRNLTFDNGPFLAFQLLIDIMLRLEQNEFARNELLEVCRENYRNDPIESRKIDKFEHQYDPRDAIKWYTADCFLYRLINYSLTSESIDLIFKLRYFIHDLHNQLAEIQPGFLRLRSQKQPILTLYRGLTMSSHDLQELQQNQGNLVSTNSFLSTTSDYEAALFFAGDENLDENLISVIYQIHVDTTVSHPIPFAKIDYQSIFQDEDEILFSMGAVFRVGEPKLLRDRLWIVELTLVSTVDKQWNVLTAHLNSR